MAKQNSVPPLWDAETMCDGCTGVLDYGYREACCVHDRAYHYGGSWSDKLTADDQFYKDMCSTPGFWGWMARFYLARRRYIGVRWITYNYPPGHPNRSDNNSYVEAFNWLGRKKD